MFVVSVSGLLVNSSFVAQLSVFLQVEGVTGVTFPERLRSKFRGDPVWASCSLKSYWRSVVRLIVEAHVAHVFSLVFSFLGVHYKGKDGICDRSVVVGRGRGQELDV